MLNKKQHVVHLADYCDFIKKYYNSPFNSAILDSSANKKTCYRANTQNCCIYVMLVFVLECFRRIQCEKCAVLERWATNYQLQLATVRKFENILCIFPQDFNFPEQNVGTEPVFFSQFSQEAQRNVFITCPHSMSLAQKRLFGWAGVEKVDWTIGSNNSDYGGVLMHFFETVSTETVIWFQTIVCHICQSI